MRKAEVGDGVLHINSHPVTCRFDYDNSFCGDECPLFEIHPRTVAQQTIQTDIGEGRTVLQLHCGQRCFFDIPEQGAKPKKRVTKVAEWVPDECFSNGNPNDFVIAKFKIRRDAISTKCTYDVDENE